MEKLSKRVLKELRKLAGTAYSRELDYHLSKLAKKFAEWQNNKINCWDLSDLIHEFHDGISRDLYKIYNNCGDEIYLIARAVANNFLKKEGGAIRSIRRDKYL